MNPSIYTRLGGTSLMNEVNVAVAYRKTVQDIAKQIRKFDVKTHKINTLEGNIRDLMRSNINNYQTPIKRIQFSDGTEADYVQRDWLQDEKTLENSIQLIKDIDNELTPDWSVKYRIEYAFDLAPELHVTISKNYYKERKVLASLCKFKEEGMEIAKSTKLLGDLEIYDFGWQHMMNCVSDIYRYGKRLLEVTELNLDVVCEILDARDLKSLLEEMIEENLALNEVSAFISQYLRRPDRPDMNESSVSNYEGEISNEES